MPNIEQIEEPFHAFPFSSGAIVEIHEGPNDNNSKLEKTINHINSETPYNYIHRYKGQHS